MSRRTWIILGAVVILIAGGIGARVYFAGQQLPEVNAEALRARELEAIVSASGKIQPVRQINISANQMGRVTRLAVEEGQRVKAGQFLLEIDPRSLSGQLERGEASVAAARSSLQQAQTAVAQARANLELAQANLRRQQELAKEGLTPRETLERSENEVAVRDAELKARLQEVQTREQQIKQEQASLSTTQYSLSQVIISAPMDGIVTRRNIEQGENVVVGTMNNAGTVLLTVADMSQIQAEIEVDETDIPNVALGQAARVTIDAVPDRTFRGHVTEIGNSPIQATSTGTGATTAQATNFKVVVTIDEPVPDVRPGFTCTAEITTATRSNVVAVPIQALTVREMLFDEKGTLVHEPPPVRERNVFGQPQAPATRPAPPEPPPGQERRETEGVFVLRDGRAVFTPVTVGIAGERYFEVRSGVGAGDQVITGPFATVREMADGEAVTISEPQQQRAANP